MLLIVVILLILSVAGLIAAVVVGTPPPDYPRHGTFGVDGFNSGWMAWTAVGLCAVGLVLLYIDSKRPQPKPREPGERAHNAGDELFGEHDLERDLQRGD